MRILVIGGTRFLGKQVVETLAAQAHSITVLSRRHTLFQNPVTQVVAERMQGLRLLSGQKFDVVLDFIGYDETAPSSILCYIQAVHYVLISSVWVPRLWGGCDAVQLCPEKITSSTAALLDVTRSYLEGKVKAEFSTILMNKKNCHAVVLRLPIFWGKADHTGRLDFYCSRLLDGGPIILVDGALNFAQIAWVQDLSSAICRWLTAVDMRLYPVWEALPDAGQSVKSILLQIQHCLSGAFSQGIDISSQELAAELPEYLVAEPLWRESPLLQSNANIFAHLGSHATAMSVWLKDVHSVVHEKNQLRTKELYFFENREIH
ncbi:MAG: hypothetical protein HQ517_10470 [SAR324 cluster bacterium]|nr:hypothetical protein [SAR324 cluster bacterium]